MSATDRPIKSRFPPGCTETTRRTGLEGYGCAGGSAVDYGVVCEELEACDSGLRSLVSVQGSAPFWERFGFRATRAFEYAPGAPSVKMAAVLRWNVRG